MKKGKIIIIGVILGILSGVFGYFGTFYLDKLRKGGEVNVSVTYEDVEEFTLENNKKLDKDDALKEWPYIFHMENSGNAKGLYQIKIIDFDENTIKREDLSFVFMINDKEIKSGKLNDLSKDILYNGEIDGNTKQDFKLYIWSNKDYQEEDVFKYKLDIQVIKTGGPGF